MGGTQVFARDSKLSRDEALSLFTIGSAWFSQEEDVKGKIMDGMYVDFAILAGDYFSIPEEEILSLESVLTVTGGNIVYASQEFRSMHLLRCLPLALHGRP